MSVGLESPKSFAHPSCRSGSFYPQPISNYLRKSTTGLAIDFPALNLLGFTCYTFSTAAFLYSRTIRLQYAHRHPDAPETTVRFNDFLFAAHGAVLCVVIYSQFFPSIWGFKVGKGQRVSKEVFGIWWGCVASVVVVALLVIWQDRQGGSDTDGWAWIDVVSFPSATVEAHVVESDGEVLTCADLHARLR